ncbi:hypothetical protein ANAPC5_01415 [Anaplasma phagocytophilum]|nr:hypothetical protein ANAPC5_01415 [Anaplasma phagocytophilum]
MWSLARLVAGRDPVGGTKAEVCTADACSAVAHSAVRQSTGTTTAMSLVSASTVLLLSASLLADTLVNRRQRHNIRINVKPASVT